MKGWIVEGEKGEVWWRGAIEEARAATEACTRGKSILSLHRKKFMKLEHKRSHVQLAPLNL